MHFINGETLIYVYAMPVLDSRMYILINDLDKQEALIIDPLISEEALPVINTLSHATILLTHSHYDHISGVTWLRQKVDCELCCSEICAKKITNPHKNLSAFSATLIMGKTEQEQAECMKFFDLNYSCHADRTYKKEISLNFGSYHVETIYTPGHSDCSQCIRMTTDKEGLAPIIVFTGDSLVNGHKIITRLPSGSKKDYLAITKPFLDSIADDILVMPGHGDWGRKEQMK